MECFVYRSRARRDTYVYLAVRDAFSVLPADLLNGLGELEFSMSLTLTPERRLAVEDASRVIDNLTSLGFHVQFPPNAHLVIRKY